MLKHWRYWKEENMIKPPFGNIKVLIDGVKKAETGMYLEEQTSITID